MNEQPATPRNAGDTDAPHSSPVTPMEDARTVLINRVSWGAVLAGIVLALVAQLILTMLGAGIGIATLNPLNGDSPDSTSLSTAAAIWWVISGIISAAIGGFAAGRLSGRPKESTAGWHGLAAWAGASLVVFLVMGTALGAVVAGPYGAALAYAQPDRFGWHDRNFETAAVGRAAGSPASTQAAQPGAGAATGLETTGASAQPQASDQQSRQIARDAARTASTAALVSAIALLIGALAAWFAGRAAAV